MLLALKLLWRRYSQLSVCLGRCCQKDAFCCPELAFVRVLSFSMLNLPLLKKLVSLLMLVIGLMFYPG
jgi:hypothetical protein